MNTLYQVSLLQALVNGYYDGIISVRDLKLLSDVAIGTFEGADGEMIMVDKKVYKAKVDGNVVEAKDNELIPFCNAAKFHLNDNLVKSYKNIKEFRESMLEYVKSKYNNLFIVIRIDGLFKNMVVRSIPKQEKPYKDLNYVCEHGQKVYNYENIYGTIIGFLSPSYMKDLNTIDFHMHFISSDKIYGGHVLDLSFDNLNIGISVKNEFKLILDNKQEFIEKDLSANIEKIKKVEE
jgi:acetolactate decarboxylase